jgi:hypothetical protein
MSYPSLSLDEPAACQEKSCTSALIQNAIQYVSANDRDKGSTAEHGIRGETHLISRFFA